MLWMVCHCWPSGARFVLNCCRHWEQILLRQPGDTLVILLSQEGVDQGNPLLMVLYGITLVPLEEDLRDADTTLLSPFYSNDVALDGSVRQSAAQIKLLMARGPDRGYLTELAKSLLIADNRQDEEAARL